MTVEIIKAIGDYIVLPIVIGFVIWICCKEK